LIARAYQTQAIDAALARFGAGDQRTLIVSPTGSGKAAMLAMVAKVLMAQGRIMVLAHRDELIRQLAATFAKVTGILPAIEKADEKSDERNMHGPPPVVVSSIQTQISGRGERKRMHRFLPCDFALCIVDECHHAPAASYRAVIDHYASNPDCKILGATATADRADGEKLGQVFQSVAFDYELPDIIADGYLVPIRQLCVQIDGLDFSKVRTTAGDLNAGELEAAMMFEKPLHGVVHATVEAACGLELGTLAPLRDNENRAELLAAMLNGTRRKTLVFSVSVAHAERMAEIFNRWIPGSAAHVDGSMTTDRRRAILKRYARGEIQFLANCMIATEGFDEPGVELVAVARPTKSRSLYSQMIGRATRPAKDLAHALGNLATADERRAAITTSIKSHCTILDFVGNSGRHRLVSTADILGARFDADAVDLAKSMANAAGAETDTKEVLREAAEEIERRKRESERKRKQREEAEERRRNAVAAQRAKLVGTSQYDLHEVDGMDRYRVRVDRQDVGSHLPAKTLATLRRAKVDDRDIARMDVKAAKALAGQIIYRYKAGLCTYRQASCLRRAGYSRDELHTMSKADATAAIETVKANGWRRPREVA
jgi:superfamily II DNA or RNA helicase